MIEHALSVLGLHISWQLQTVALETRESGAVEPLTLDSISSRRNALLEKCEEFAVGNETNAVEGVKEMVSGYLQLRLSFVSCCTDSSLLPTGSLSSARHSFRLCCYHFSSQRPRQTSHESPPRMQSRTSSSLLGLHRSRNRTLR